jgi:hypothetical protein
VFSGQINCIDPAKAPSKRRVKARGLQETAALDCRPRPLVGRLLKLVVSLAAVPCFRELLTLAPRTQDVFYTERGR